MTVCLADRLLHQIERDPLISTPAPKAKISPITRKLMRNQSATKAPITSEEAARVPQPNAAAIYRLASGYPVLRAAERATG